MMSKPHSPGSNGEDTNADDTLICGFGQKEESDSVNSGHMHQIGGSTTADNRCKNETKGIHSSLLVGFGGDCANSDYSGSGDNMGEMAQVDITAMINQHDHGIIDDQNAHDDSEMIQARSSFTQKQHSQQDDTEHRTVPKNISHPTKPTQHARPLVPRTSSYKSVNSDCDTGDTDAASMASEDAVVLMVNVVVEGDGEDGGEEGGKAKKKKVQHEVVGRIFKGEQNTDYESIPIEFEIENGPSNNQSWSPFPNGGGARDLSDSNNNNTGILGGFNRQISSLGGRASETEMAWDKSDANQRVGVLKQPLNSGTVSFDDTAVSINDGEQLFGENGETGKAKRAVSFQSFSLSYPSDMDNQHRLSSGGTDLNLDVIEEDEDSTSASGANDSSDSPVPRGSYYSPSNQPKPMGEHARSMAKQLSFKVDAKVGFADTKKTRAPKPKKRPQEEGRLAIVSRNSETEYVKVIVPKPDSVKTLIHDAISGNILFKACSTEELHELVEVFAPMEASAGSTILRQGDEGDAFFVMERGTVDVYEGDEHKSTLYAGTSFGEIALLYGCPRSATIRTRYFCKLWTISRAAFRAITSQFKSRRMEAKVNSLKKVKIKDKFLSDVLTESELNTLALATLNESYPAGHTIVQEGEPGDIFYMIDSGDVDVFIEAKGSAPVVTLKSGQFFGELALLSNDCRTASCVAKTEVQCHILMRNDFNLLLGDLQSLLMDGSDYRKREEEFVPPEKNAEASCQVKLSDLELLKVLGIGAFGRVRLARLRHPVEGIKNDDGYFALKCISKESLKENGLESHILNEKKIMSGLNHPFINRYYCGMEDEQYLYFLLEALPGGELCKRLREEKMFPEPWGKFYSASVLFAFCHMHAKKIAYRDLKPENLVMDHVGYVKVVDFGLAKVIEGGKTWTLCGTPAYLAPEIVLNDGHDWAVDYWALGVFLFEMTCGKEPFAAKNPMEVYKQIVSGHVEIPSSFSPNLTDLITKLLNTSKSKRLGRTMGGGGAVMQHRWYSDFDWDGHLERRLEVPLQPKTQEILCDESEASDSRDDSSAPSSSVKSPAQSTKKGEAAKNAMKNARLTYSLGQGNRHHQKLLEMMDSSCGTENNNGSEQQVDTVRMTMMRVIKQHERWSKTSRSDSTNSSTRNTRLGTGPRSSKRDSVNTESGMSIGSAGCLDAFLRLQLMHLSLASKRFSQNLETNRAFQQFSLLSIPPTSTENEKYDLRPSGTRFLDPFITKKIDLIDQYPSGLSEADIDAEALAAFCFPNGLRIRLIPRCAEEGARRLGWLGELGDSYQMQGFTDVAGSLSHGCAIIIREVCTPSEASAVSSAIAFHRARRRSAVVITRWMKKHLRRPVRSHAGPNVNSTRQIKPRSRSVVEKASSMKWKRKGAFNGGVTDEEKSEDRYSAAGLRAAMDAMKSMSTRSKVKAASMDDIAFGVDDDIIDDDTDSFEAEYCDEYPPVPEHVRQLGISAYNAMIESAKGGDICIVEKSYVLTGTKLQDQSLFFCALQNLIEMERKINDKAAKRLSALGDEQMGKGVHYSFRSDNRQAVLSALRSKLALTPSQRRVSYPRNEVAHINNPQQHFVMDLSIMGFSKISLPLPLPEMSGQWGLATLFLRIKDSGLIILLKLLLLERSVLVVGETPEEVTACTTALLELLDPYKWASAFMPLLPRDMLDFVSSPVPFIAGMIVEGKQHLHSIIHDHGVKEAMLSGLSIVNLVSGKLIVTREQGTSDMLRRSFQTIPELSFYQKRLEEYCSSPTSHLKSFASFFQHGATRKESLTLRKIKVVIKKHMSQFTMGLSDKPDAWQQYGEFNEATGTFDFCPDKFIQPLKDRMIFQIQFQEMMAHTQLFVGYVEEIQLAHEKRSNLLSGPAANFIARWVELHWQSRRWANELAEGDFLEQDGELRK